jgi:ribonuclease HII
MSLEISERELELASKFGGRLVGIDESGISCYAGPIVYAAALVDYSNPLELPPVTDGKKFYPSTLIKAHKNLASSRYLIDHTVVYVSPKEVDRYGTRIAKQKGLRRIFKAISARNQINFVVIDFHAIDDLGVPQLSIKKADSRFYCVAAASVIAKFHHDDYMLTIHKQHPEYRWDKNKGSSTSQEHRELILEHGISKYHRRTWCMRLFEGVRNVPTE